MRREVVLIATLLAMRFGFAVSTLKSDEAGKRGANDEFSKDIAFDLPDLSAIVETTTGQFQLEAFKWSKNDQILERIGQQSSVGAATSISTELRWVSIGYVTFVKTTDPKNPNTTNLFHKTEDGFTTYIDMLSPAHRNILAEVAKKKYRVDVTGDQIFHLILSKFECSRKMYDESTGAKYLLKGEVSVFHHFPLQMDFEAPHGSIERRLFGKELDGEGSSRKFNCRVFSHGKDVKTNRLTLTSYQQQIIGLEEKLFGLANTSATEMREIPTDVLVTRVQATELANEMYTSLNILEEYEMPELQFSEAFVSDLISQIAASSFAHVPIDEALSSLSKYGFDIREDLNPDVIKRNLGSVFTIETIGDESKIVLNTKNKDNLDTSSSSEVGAEVSASAGIPLVLEASVRGAVKTADNNAYSGASEKETLSDQLKKLNSQTQNDVKWEIEGNRIVPKSLNVVRLTRSKLGKTLSFSRVRRQTFTALFDRYFSLYPDRAVADMSILQNMISEISNLRDLVDQLSTVKDEWQRYVDSKIQSVKTTTDQLQTSVDSQFQSIRSDVISHQSSVNDQFQSIRSSVSSQQTSLNNYNNQISRINDAMKILQNKPTISSCQLCFHVSTSSNCYYYNTASYQKELQYCTGTTSNIDSLRILERPLRSYK